MPHLIGGPSDGQETEQRYRRIARYIPGTPHIALYDLCSDGNYYHFATVHENAVLGDPELNPVYGNEPCDP